MKIIKDGNKFCVQKGNFKNLQESKDYFFIDKKELNEFRKTEKDLVELAKIGEETKDRDEYVCKECEFEISEQEYKDGGLCESCARLLS